MPKAFVTELTDDAAAKLRDVREELRVYEYEAELLYSEQPFTSNSPFFDVSLSPSTVRERTEEDSWIPLPEQESKVRYSRSFTEIGDCRLTQVRPSRGLPCKSCRRPVSS